ncbi:hypothetical protein TNCV_4979221 [Trichonephila clavipes]|nr:hypothetical protein TNCV_4979221 [Trichonephila clavipes]
MAGVMVWSAIVYDTQSPLGLIHRPLTATSTTSFSYMCSHSWQGSREPFFNRTMLGHTKQGCHKIASATLPPFPGLLDRQIYHQSIISDHLGWQVGQHTSLVELEAHLQQLWNGTSYGTCIIWLSEHPHAILEDERDGPKGNMFCAGKYLEISGLGFFAEKTVTEINYLPGHATD